METPPENCSSTPLPRKLGIKPGTRLLLDGAPAEFDAVLGQLPDGVERVREGPADVLVSFHTERAALEARIGELRPAMDPAAGLWIAWPKRASKVPTDITENVVREIALSHRLVDNKVAAIDEVWSGLRLVIRLVDR
jgi:hypothetical protein